MPVGGAPVTRGLIAAMAVCVVVTLSLPAIAMIALLWLFGVLSKQTAFAAVLLCAVGWAAWMRRERRPDV